MRENKVTALGGVSGNVSDGPNSLLTNIVVGGEEKVAEFGDGTSLHDKLGLLRRA